MVCVAPRVGYRSPGGQIVSSRRFGYSDQPQTVGCGQCIKCLLARSRDWSIRCVNEASLYCDNCFVTLTYRDEDLPEGGSLDKSHHQLFMKRLRFRFKDRTIRYFNAGEYGTQTWRPHYHTLLFNLNFADRRFHKHSKTGHKIFVSEELDELWSHGDAYIGNVTLDSAGYVARYATKKLGGRRVGEYGDRVPEYSTQSRDPPIGVPFLLKYPRDVFPHDGVVVNGLKLPVPKAYDKYLLDREEVPGEWGTDYTGAPVFYPSLEFTEMEKIKGKRVRKALLHREDQTKERLLVIEQLQMIRAAQLKREL